MVRPAGRVPRERRCTPTRAGTLVVHREEFHPHPLLQPAFEWFFAAWLTRDVCAEVDRLTQLLAGQASTRGGTAR